MKKNILLVVAISAPMLLSAQGATDAYQLAQPDLKGTARFMSMGGAFGALGGDLSTLNQNPAGIGVYRSSEIGVTFDVDIQSTKSTSQGVSMSKDQTKVYCNNFGYVGTSALSSEIMPYFSWGCSFSRVQSFDRVYRGSIPSLNSSLSNYIASSTNAERLTQADLQYVPGKFDPYYNSIGANYYAPWISILAYDAYAIVPTADGDSFNGLITQPGAMGNATFMNRECGYVDEYSINFGGNIMNTVYWGLGVGITDIDYKSETYYDEVWSGATIVSANERGTETGKAYYGLSNYLHNYGTGVNVKLGVIVKPTNELRLGLAVHTPTWYAMESTYYAAMDYDYSSGVQGYSETNGGYEGHHAYDYSTPWRLIASAAGVIGGRGIISVDYEYVDYGSMAFSDEKNNYDIVNDEIDRYYKAMNIVRVGGEYRVTPQFSVRAGYSYQSSPVEDSAADGRETIYTAGTQPAYAFDNTTQYITCGLGYRYKGFYADMAYVHKNRESTYHPFSPTVDGSVVLDKSPSVKVKDNNNSLVFSVGYKF